MNGQCLVVLASLTAILSVPPVQAQELDFWLAHGESELIQISATAGETITASCNENCLDLDLYLYDAEGNLLAKDSERNIAPTLLAPYDGEFLLEVFMPNCKHPEGCTAWLNSQADS
ncbi:MAG: hypothetical protein F6K11_22315 [Leptolyngbya sp. SIO3F4]|nr:hypothetical protein [Leptolyngbya sp. SIO3F4]